MFGSVPSRFLRLFLFLLLSSFWLPGVLHSQPKSTPSTSGITGDQPLLGTTKNTALTANGTLSPVERPINPETYRLGPNDQLVVSVPSLEMEFPVIVSLDNSVSLPRGFALISVENMTLAGLRRMVDSLYKARSKSYQNIGVSLFKPRSIYVTVSGDVLNPNRFILSAADRVTAAIDAANQISSDIPEAERSQFVKEKSLMRPKGSSIQDLGTIVSGMLPYRHIIIRHNDGTSHEVDLLHYQAFGDESQNPTLREGDHVIVQRSNPVGSTIAIAGAVNTPMVVPFTQGDNALMLTRLSAGVRDDAATQNAYIARQSSAGISTIAVNLNDSTALAAIMLAPGDQLIVPALSDGSGARAGIVAVTGEVGNPSAYAIVPGTTRLSEVIEKAGGFTRVASLNGAYITRAIDPRSFKSQYGTIEPIAGMATSSLKLEDTTRFKFDLELQQNRVSADFVGLFQNHDASKDVTLENGDAIVVPRDPGNVFVRGRIAQPGWVAYKAGADYKYYIAATGGFTEAADQGRVIVEKYGSGISEDGGSATIRPGDAIYVPGERDTPARTGAEVAATYVGIVSSLVFLAVNIITFIQQQNKP